MIRVSQLKLPVSHSREQLEKKLAKTLRIPWKEIESYEIIRQSIDARQKPDLRYVYTIDVSTKKENQILKKVNHNNIMLIKKNEYQMPERGTDLLAHRPVVVGNGPAGLYCAYLLALGGLRPMVLERGEEAQKRQKTVETFWNTGRLNPQSNVQFGEGGAGTFSDGKLNTMVKDAFGRNRKVLELFVKAGAPEEILYVQKPHLGTDQLVMIVGNIRKMITDMGGTFHFNSQVTDLITENHCLRAVEINDKEQIPTEVCILAVGHSARDTFAMLKRRNLPMEQKSFAVGVRIEHPQRMINLSQYGIEEPGNLGAASYKLTHQLPNGRGIYSFCMCPGGYVVNASSEEGHLAVNGMSYQARAGENANSAMIVTISPQDFGSDDVLAGVEFQKRLEKKAFEAGQGRVPVQLLEDFIKNCPSDTLGAITPSIKGKYLPGNVRSIFPDTIAESLAEGICACDKKIHGFARPDAVLSGVESRTSSPVRMVRDQQFMSRIAGIYPCGEGAGYAGGITSAAMDGLKVAEAILKKYGGLKPLST